MLAYTSCIPCAFGRGRDIAEGFSKAFAVKACALRSSIELLSAKPSEALQPSVADSMADCLTADCTTYFLSPQKELPRDRRRGARPFKPQASLQVGRPEKTSPPASSHLMNERSTGSINMCLRTRMLGLLARLRCHNVEGTSCEAL